MAPRKEVTSLEDLCLQTLQSHVTTLILNYANDEQERIPIEESELNNAIKTHLFDNLPPSTHGRFIELLILQLGKFFKNVELVPDSPKELLNLSAEYEANLTLRFPDDKKKKKAILKYFLSPISYLKVRKISLGWHPLFIEEEFVDLLKQMTRLETFTRVNVGITFATLEAELLSIGSVFSNLSSFTYRGFCTDDILAVICKNCKSISNIDVKESNASDNCIEHLVKCDKLQSVNLKGTNISREGFLKFLTQSKSADLVEIFGLERHVCMILNRLKYSADFSPIFSLQRLFYSDVAWPLVSLVPKHFPHLTQISLEFKRYLFPLPQFDFSELLSIKNLKKVDLKFVSENFDMIHKVVSSCPRITSLTLYNILRPVSDANNILLDIIGLCPKIEKLSIKGFSRSEHSTFDPRVQVTGNFFENLTMFNWSIGMMVPFAQYVLCRAPNIETVKFSHSSICDRFFECVLEQNPLKKLRRLTLHFGHKLSLEILKQIISRCEKLSYLCIHPLGEEKALKKFISEHNYDVYFSHSRRMDWCDCRGVPAPEYDFEL